MQEQLYKATILAGVIDAIAHLDNDGHADAATAVITVAQDRARELAADLDRANSLSRREAQ